MVASHSAASASDKRNADVREAVERELDHNLPDSTWAYLIEKRYVEDYSVGASNVRDLANEARAILQAGGRSKPRRAVGQEQKQSARGALDARAKAVGQLDAARVAREGKSVDGVTIDAFRGDHLRDFIPAGEPLYEWLEKRSQHDGRPTIWLKVKLPRGGSIKNNPDSARGGIVPVPTITVGAGKQAADGIDELTMTVPDDLGPTEIRITEGGVLDDLRRLAARVAREVGWTEPEAIEYILTGTPPVAPLIDTDVRPGRVTLSVHPSVTPRELAAAYSAIRRERGLPARRLSEKHTALAAFLETRAEGEKWAHRMRAWNAAHSKEHEDWRYAAVTNFARDAVQARRRMEERHGKATS